MMIPLMNKVRTFGRIWVREGLIPPSAADRPIGPPPVTRGGHDEPKIANVPLTAMQLTLLRESLWHSVQRGDIMDDERKEMHELREIFANELLDAR